VNVKKEISDKATTCPHCGNPIQQKEVKEDDTFKLNETGVGGQLYLNGLFKI